MMATPKPKPATLWLLHAVHDYASARCLLLSGLQGGFVLGQQALEKLLKAFLQLAHPGTARFVGPRGITPAVLGVTPGHDLVAHFQLVQAAFPVLTPTDEQMKLLEDLSYCFEGKYPDATTPLSYTTTAWVTELDQLFVSLALSIPLPQDVRWKTGIYGCVWHLEIPDQPRPIYAEWVVRENYALANVYPEIQRVVAVGWAAEQAMQATA